MLIAQLIRYRPFGGDEVLYCGADPFDNERLTQWHETITQVDDELRDLGKCMGLNLASYAGESDVPDRPRQKEADGPDHDSIACGCPAIPCH